MFNRKLEQRIESMQIRINYLEEEILLLKTPQILNYGDVVSLYNVVLGRVVEIKRFVSYLGMIGDYSKAPFVKEIATIDTGKELVEYLSGRLVKIES